MEEKPKLKHDTTLTWRLFVSAKNTVPVVNCSGVHKPESLVENIEFKLTPDPKCTSETVESLDFCDAFEYNVENLNWLEIGGRSSLKI